MSSSGRTGRDLTRRRRSHCSDRTKWSHQKSKLYSSDHTGSDSRTEGMICTRGHDQKKVSKLLPPHRRPSNTIRTSHTSERQVTPVRLGHTGPGRSHKAAAALNPGVHAVCQATRQLPHASGNTPTATGLGPTLTRIKIPCLIRWRYKMASSQHAPPKTLPWTQPTRALPAGLASESALVI